MIRQYYASRRRGGFNPLGVGVISIGSIYYIQDEGFFRGRYSPRPVCRNPWIVEGFMNGVMHAARRNPVSGFWDDKYISGRCDTAIVRSLRDGRRLIIAVRTLIAHDDLFLTKEPTTYPSWPDLRLYRGRANATAVTHAAPRRGVGLERRGSRTQRGSAVL